jgi:hypothetical protein
VGELQIRFHACDDRSGFDQFVERHISPQPSAVAVDLQDSSDLQFDARKRVGQVPIEFGVGGGSPDERELSPVGYGLTS